MDEDIPVAAGDPLENQLEGGALGGLAGDGVEGGGDGHLGAARARSKGMYVLEIEGVATKDKKLKDYSPTALIEKMWKMQYCRDLKLLSKDCLRFALLSSNFFLIDHRLYREAARGK